ncbi:MAG: acetate--CoA ligase [Gammaproteobacteria bacterium]|nr:acetate--CoA ligase [Gammaproteobacteria bacterium]
MADHLDSVLIENRRFPPAKNFSQHATLKNTDVAALKQQAETDFIGFWDQLATRHLDWQTPYTRVLDDSRAPFYEWFTGGKINVSANCLDRHLKTRGDKTAIIFEGEPGDIRKLTYRELHREVSQFANVLISLGIQLGDRVVIYMPMVPEAVIAMQACARIGAIHSVVFGGFSAESLKDRIENAGAKLLITADGGHRGGKIIPLKETTDKALAAGCATIENVVVLQRTHNNVSMHAQRDHQHHHWWHTLMQSAATECAPVWVDSEHPLFLLYTSGSTGKPKGIQHSSAGYLLWSLLTNLWVFDLKDTDIFWCTADVGWITGHSYVTYGPLAAGATIVMYEGAPTIPDAGRFWKICQDHHVSIFYTAPTALRALMKLGDDIPAQYDLSKLRLLGSVGEPINPEAWMWYHNIIGHERCPIVDTWWQTETGAHMLAPVPGVTTTKPGSCTQALPGIFAAVVDDHGERITHANQGGYLVITKPWPGMLRNIWGDSQRYIDTYWNKFSQQYYVAGDSARCDADGDFWIMGRIDDVVNVSGHRLGTMEIESALVAHAEISEAAVVSFPHDIKGEAIFAFVVPRNGRPKGAARLALEKDLQQWVTEQIGALAKPEVIRFADNLPKTRSGKIMRRLLRTIARDEPITQDISTLENPAILEQLTTIDHD